MFQNLKRRKELDGWLAISFDEELQFDLFLELKKSIKTTESRFGLLECFKAELAMSSISSISSGYAASSLHRAQSARSNRRTQGLEQDLTRFLTESGVDSQTQTQILSEVKQGLGAVSSSGRPDFAKVKEVVGKILGEHGLDAQAFASQVASPPTSSASASASLTAGRPSGPPAGAPRPSGPPPGGPPESQASAESSSASEEEETFLEKLLALLLGTNNESSSTSATQETVAEARTQSIDLYA